MHTPGPWYIYEDEHGHFPPYPGIESLRGTIVFFGEQDESDMGIHEPKNNDRLANANLIAAAPDLLEACKFALQESWCCESVQWRGVEELIKKAVAKAEGKS